MGEENKNKDAETKLSAADAITKIADGMQKIFEDMTKAQNESSAKIEALLSKQNELIEQQIAAQTKANESFKNSDEQLQKQVTEGREFLLVLAQAHKAFVDRCGVIVEKSNIEIANAVGSMKAQAENRLDAEKRQKAQDGGESYKSVAERFV